MPAVLLPCITACHRADSSMTTFTAQHFSTAREIVVPFSAPPTGAGGALYRDPLFGLKLESVTADGDAVPGVEAMALLDDLDLRTFESTGETHVYVVTSGKVVASEGAWTLVSATEVTEESYELQLHAIPRGTARFQVRYRVRNPQNNELGPELTLESTATDL